MNWAIVIPVGIGIAVLLSIALIAIDVSGQISRQEEADEVRFYWDSMLMYSKRVSPDAPPDYEVKTLYENRKDFVRDVQSTTSAAVQRWFTRIARAETVIHGSV